MGNIFRSKPRVFTIYITEQQIADARDNQVKYPSHREYVADRFLTEFGLHVIDHRFLQCDLAPNEKTVMYSGELGVALTARKLG